MTELDRIRTDVVGSLLRPALWKDARARFDKGLLSPDDFAAVQRTFFRIGHVICSSP